MRALRAFVLAISLALWVPAAFADTVSGGSLSVSSGEAITDTQLRSWINEFIPNDSKRLLVLTQCFGGNMLDKFMNDANTAIASATSPGQKAVYRGYDRGASFGLAPLYNGFKGDPRNTDATAVHTTGTQTKDKTENPATGGGLALTNFDLGQLAPDMFANPPLQESRHILIYAGKPEDGKGRDIEQRDKIKNAFKNEPRTTVTSVGGSGGGGWDYPGTAKGLRDALATIKKQFDIAANKSKEQFVLYVTDHGDSYNKMVNANPIPIPSAGFINGLIRGLMSGAGPLIFPPNASKSDLSSDPDNTPGFDFFVPIDSTNMFIPGVNDPFSSNAFSLQVTEPGASMPLSLSSFQEQFVDLDPTGEVGNGIIGNTPGEGVNFFFPVDEPTFLNRFFDVDNIQMRIFNNTNTTWSYSDTSIDTGAIAKAEAFFVPLPPASLTGAAMLGLLSLRRIRRAFHLPAAPLG